MSQEQTLNDAAHANLTTGVLMLCKEALVTAIQDKRLDRSHLRVLAAMVGFMNSRSAKAWPSRAMIAEALEMNIKTVSNVLLDLRNYNYLIAERQAVEEASNRRLTVYTFGNIDHETIRREITAFVKQVRDGRRAQEVPPQRELQSPVPAGTSRPSGNNSAAKVPPQRVEKSRPSGSRNSEKELYPIGAEKTAQTKPESFKSILWLHGIGWLVRTYNGSVPEKEIRSRLGLLIKNHGQGLVMHSLGCAEQTGAVDPLDYMTGMLNHGRPPKMKQATQPPDKLQANLSRALQAQQEID